MPRGAREDALDFLLLPLLFHLREDLAKVGHGIRSLVLEWCVFCSFVQVIRFRLTFLRRPANFKIVMLYVPCRAGCQSPSHEDHVMSRVSSERVREAAAPGFTRKVTRFI